MFALSSARPRTHSQSSFTEPAPQHRSEDYLISPSGAHMPLPSENTPRYPKENHGRVDLYPQPNGHIYNNNRHNGSANYSSRESMSPDIPFSQSYGRRLPSSSDLQSTATSYRADRFDDPSRPDSSLLGRYRGGDIPNILDTFNLSASQQDYPPEPRSAMLGPASEHSNDSDFWPTNAPKGDQSEQPKPKKPRREKPRIELAPDQPPTTQGKPRARVYVACLQCRTRKIRCDGAKPVCHNCGRRPNGGNDCNYDPIPKRRGPDKTPGSRQRMARDVRNEIDNSGSVRRRRRTRDNPTSDTNGISQQEQLPHRQPSSEAPQNRPSNDPISLKLAPDSPVDIPSTGGSFVSGSDYSRSSYSLCSCHGLLHCPGLLGDGALSDSRKSFPPVTPYNEYDLSNLIPPYSGNAGRGYIAEVDENGNERDPQVPGIGSEPSLNFSRKIWWDSLLSLYSSPESTRLQTLTISQRESAAQSITADLRFLFRSSNYWFSFFHIPSFFRNFFDPTRRDRVQPCLILALLAMSTFWQSSEVGYGKAGRERALRFRDEAQAAMDASFNAGWIDETLAQTAWLLALFEVCSHPRHSSERSTSSMVMLDSIIRSLSLTHVDQDDANASKFSPGTVPVVSSSPKPRAVWLPQSPGSRSSPDVPYAHNSSTTQGNNDAGCSCQSFTLEEHWMPTNDHAPLWSSTPAWDENWSEAEIRKESCRRLCWSSMILAAGHISYTTAHRSQGLDLFIADPSNYALLFSGESVARSPMLYNHNSKDTIWALHDRCFLLWHGCIRMRNNNRATDNDKAQFAVKAWLEADSLVHALNRHTCAIERAFIFQAREYIFNTRMCISYEFQRYIPLVTANVNGLFHRNKAEEWLTHQAAVAERFMCGLHTITGNSNNLLARRPFFVFWFMGQIHRALALYGVDKTLTVALDVCKALIPAIDYLTALWPCPEQRYRYESLREKVANSCFIAGIDPPPPINLSLPTPASLASLV